MNSAKITVSLNQHLLERLKQLQKTRLAGECAKLDPKEEQTLADLGLSAEKDQWPPY